jgi:hypothetical protein
MDEAAVFVAVTQETIRIVGRIKVYLSTTIRNL